MAQLLLSAVEAMDDINNKSWSSVNSRLTSRLEKFSPAARGVVLNCPLVLLLEAEGVKDIVIKEIQRYEPTVVSRS